MKKVIVRDVGGPEVLEVVTAASFPLGHGELLVEVEAAGINYIDIYQRQGLIDLPRLFTPGLEGVGTVREVGAGVSSVWVGTRVAWINAMGSYASHVAIPEAQAIRVPATFTLAQSLLFQGITTQYLLAEYHSVKPGDIALVHAAAGGVGQMLVQWLKHLGATVIGTASTPAKLQTILDLGADHAVNYGNGDFLDALLDLTQGRGVDVAYDAVGATTFGATVRALAPRGTAISYGQASGVAPAVDIFPLIMKGARVAGASLFVYIDDAVEMQRRATAVIAALEEGWLHATATTTFNLDDAAEAHRRLESRSTQGKLALVLNS